VFIGLATPRVGREKGEEMGWSRGCGGEGQESGRKDYQL